MDLLRSEVQKDLFCDRIKTFFKSRLDVKHGQNRSWDTYNNFKRQRRDSFRKKKKGVRTW